MSREKSTPEAVPTAPDRRGHPSPHDGDGDGQAEAPALRRHAVLSAHPPVLLEPNQFERFYLGGSRIDRLRGRPEQPGRRPEDWIGSTTTAFGEQQGLSRLPDGRLLRDAIETDPVGFLGREHVACWGADPALLVKLLDAGERLPVHFHPGRAFARDALGLRFGKTEAWIIISCERGATVHAGFRDPVAPPAVQRWVEEQDVDAMLAAMNRMPLAPGDVVFVPAGTPHAIGEGILLLELQEPTDLSVLLEWHRLDLLPGAETLGLGWERALQALNLDAIEPAELRTARWTSGGAGGAVQELLPDAAAPYFGAQRIAPAGDPVDLDPSFAILVVLDGFATLWSESGGRLELGAGDTVLVPHGAGRSTLDGHATLIRCLPPLPGAGSGTSRDGGGT